MTIAEWILLMILACVLLIFLVVAIILCIKIIGLTKEAKKIIITGQDIAGKADDIAGKAGDVVDNVKGMTSFGRVVKTVSDQIIDSIGKKSAQNIPEAEQSTTKSVKSKSKSSAKNTSKSTKND